MGVDGMNSADIFDEYFNIDDGNGNIINARDGYIDYTEVLNKIRNELKDMLKQPVGFISPSVRGLMDYIGDVLGE